MEFESSWITSKQLMSTTPPLRDTTAILPFPKEIGFRSVEKVTASFSLCSYSFGLKNSRAILSPKCQRRIRWANASSIKKRTDDRTTRRRPNLDQSRDLSRDEALAGILDRSRLPGTVHGIGVQHHSSA